MLTKDMLKLQIPVLRIDQTGEEALSLMEEWKLKHLPVVNEGKYLFLLSEKEVQQMVNVTDRVQGVSTFSPYVYSNTAVVDVLHLMAKDSLSILPVLGEDGRYLGAVTQQSLLEKLDHITNAGQQGSLIAIESRVLDYNLSDIARIAESNDAQIISVFTFPASQSDKLTVLLKINLEDATPFLRSLERFDYPVLYYSQKGGVVDEIIQKRIDELLFYLKM